MENQSKSGMSSGPLSSMAWSKDTKKEVRLLPKSFDAPLDVNGARQGCVDMS